MKIRSEADLETLQHTGGAQPPGRLKITVGMATCGQAAGAEAVLAALEQQTAKRGLDLTVATTGCLGFCQQEPLVDVDWPGKGRRLFGRVTPARARRFVDGLAEGAWPSAEALAAFGPEPGLPRLDELPFYARQQRVVLRRCGLIDPARLDDYVAHGGYDGLARAVFHLTPAAVIDEVTRSGLRGRGGGGFSTGRKWLICCEAVAVRTPPCPPYLICNADEGDPGAYMDRTVLESDPFSVVEGLTIAAYATGAREGYIYVRDEYPLALKRVSEAVVQAENAGLLGEDILGAGFDFSLTIVRGAGAFVCGEETALISSIEGGTGEPRPKPPYPAFSGLWGRPTVINNVKTLASVSAILARGADWYAGLGALGNSGTVVFSLVGKVANTGLVEVPLGMSLGELVEQIGGGGLQGKPVKAVQTGGPSGGCLPRSLFHLPITYETMAEAGSIIGSGGLVVMDEDTCMVDVARYFIGFTLAESCGKCTFCREGLRHAYGLLTRIVQGQATLDDLALLEEVAHGIQTGSLCGLGQTAPNPVISTLRHFRDEYLAHVVDKRCPAGVCRALARPQLSESRA